MTDLLQSPETPSPAAPGGSPPSPAPRPNRWRWLLVTALIGIAVFAAGAWYFGRPPESAAAPAAAAQMPALPVTVAKPLKQQIMEWDEFTGQFQAVESVEIRARVSGYLDKIGFQDGQLVNKGDLLFVIDQRPFQITLNSAQSALNSANARLALAKQELARAQELRKNDFTSQSTLDQRQQAMLSAAADVQVDQAAINSAQLNLDFTQISAPVSGRISQHEVSIGNLVIGGDTSTTTLLTTIVSLDPIRLLFDMPESAFLAYQRRFAEGKMPSTRASGIEVQAHLMDESDWSLKGTLDFVDNQVDRTSGTIRARALFPNPGLLITPGQFGRVRIPGSEPYEAILIPDSAIVSDQSQKIVMTVGADGTVTPKPIRPGPSYQGLRIVRDGLNGDETIIIDGLLRARPGGKVAPTQGKIELQPDIEN
ncbi:MAG TPA: efflux RND transporter periplasmic adaptor subunit [Candidatus Cybelea sp.]|nr:efflux RND transporter periplasmic adaptor subunit [Candidatus Cybelea sp.]